MNAEAIREVLALHVAGRPAETISFGSVVTIIADPDAAARWMEATPNGLLPVSRVPVQVVPIALYEVCS